MTAALESTSTPATARAAIAPWWQALVLALLCLLGQAAPAQAEQGCPRIVSQAPYITQNLRWLGLEPCIVGVSRYDELDLPRTGGLLDPDAEVLALLAPELWFASDWAEPETVSAATPSGTRAFRLGGFGGMGELEESLRTIGRAAQVADIEARVAAFHADWQRAAAALNGGDTPALLLSACSGTPYSYGRGTWLHELFTTAGFRVLEQEQKIRHLTPEAPLPDLAALLRHYRPKLVFVFENSDAGQCRLLTASFPVRVVTLDNALFMHPAPELLKGLEALADRAGAWER